ncbi:MAG: mechanosensitive ion channel family protein [Acidobacteriaceae bacterium]|nr:mechanosensitive ion channel family protein [Acidobacteriaceae bacterium]
MRVNGDKVAKMYRSASLLALLLLAQPSHAQLPLALAPKPPASTQAAQQDPLGRDTPRGCVLGFLKAADQGDYRQAAQYLDTAAAPAEAEELARQLQVVINRGLVGNVDQLSRSPEGALKDGVGNNRDQVGYVETSFGRMNILLDRGQHGTAPPIWLFSPETLRDVPRTFEEINAPGFERYFPRPLREIRLLSLPLWRWLTIILSLGLALILASLVTRGLITLLRGTVHRLTGHTADDRYLLPLRQPMRLVLLALAIRLQGAVALSALARAFWAHVAQILAIAGISWLLIQFSDIVSDRRSRQLVRRQSTGQIAVLSLAHRLFKILVLFSALAFLLHGAGVNVSAMLAGLGIGGIALALAAQKTLEDLFGGISIISRKSVRVGDFCQLADKQGTIEDIGLGSTRVRTLDRTIVTIPNGKVSQMSLENYSLREKIWFHHIFGLRYDTSPEQVRSVLTQITQMLRDDRRVETESARIRLIAFGPSSLNFEIFAYVKVTDYTAFVEIQEDLLLRIMDIVAANGTTIALPSQITYLDRDHRDGAYKERVATNAQHKAEQVQHEP